MHPSLSAYPSQAFYQGRLLDGVTAAQRPRLASSVGSLCGGTTSPGGGNDMRVVFVDVDKGVETSLTGWSKVSLDPAWGGLQVCMGGMRQQIIVPSEASM